MSAPDYANYQPKILLAQRGMSIHVAKFLDGKASVEFESGLPRQLGALL